MRPASQNDHPPTNRVGVEEHQKKASLGVINKQGTCLRPANHTLKPRLSQPSSPLIPGVHCVEPRAKYADAVCLAPKPRAQARRGQLTSAATLSAVAVLNYDRSTRAT